MIPAREVLALNPDPGNPIEPLDFQSVSLLNAWTNRQKKSVKFLETFVGFAVDLSIFFVEATSLMTILIHGLLIEKVAHDAETICSVVFWVVGVFAATFMKFADDECKPKQKSFCARVGKWIVNLLLPVKVFRYFVAFRYTAAKERVFGQAFSHGETISREQVDTIISINEYELVDARYELYETYTQAIPMALLQHYFLFSSHETFALCNYQDVARLVIVIFHLISAGKNSAAYDWKKKQLESSQHVLAHVRYNGRYPMPMVNQDRGSHGLNTACHFMSILSRFYLICFFMAVHWSLGIIAITLLFISNWFLYYFFLSVRSSVENLPIGIPISLSCIMDRWINTFTAKETRFNELSRPMKTCCCRSRYPVIFTQIFTFLFSFLILYGFILTSDHFFELAHQSLTIGGTVTTVNASICHVTGTFSDNIGFFSYIGDLLASAQSALNSRFGTFGDFYNIIHLHWLLLYLHVVLAFVYNHYCSTFGLYSDNYPVILSVKFVKNLFQKLLRDAGGHEHVEVSLIRRFLFLISTDLKSFNLVMKLHESSKLSEGAANIDRWWNDIMRAEAYKIDGGCIGHRPSWTGSPLFNELGLCYEVVRRDALGSRVLNYCLLKLDDTLLKEMTSDRLEKTFELFGVSKLEMCGCSEEENVINV